MTDLATLLDTLEAAQVTGIAALREMIGRLASPSPAQWPEEAAGRVMDALFNVLDSAPWGAVGAAVRAALATLPPPGEGVAMPQNADQAAMMALLGEKWLREHAPERLLPPPEDGRVKGLVDELSFLQKHCGDLAHFLQIIHPNEEAVTEAYHKARYAKERAATALASYRGGA